MDNKLTLYKDCFGNLYYYEGYDNETQLHHMVDVEEDNGHFIYTHNDWYYTDTELNECIKIEVKEW